MYDLVIVGGGPSGSSAARQAGKLGLNVLLLEAKAFPRYKPCGGALSERALSYLDFELLPGVIEREIYGLRIYFSGSKIENYSPARLAVMVSRANLDQYLLKKAEEAHCTVVTGEKVHSCEEKGSYVVIISEQKTYRARYVIIAEGAQGQLKKQVKKTDTKKDYGLGLVTEIPASNEIINKPGADILNMHFGYVKMGYGWIFPHEKYFSVGICKSGDNLAKTKKALFNFLSATGFNRYSNLRFKGHLIPTGGIKQNITSRRMLLSGDAAGFADSFSGEGISYAIRSGQLAAEAVYGMLKEKENSLSSYESACCQEMSPNLDCSFSLAKIVHHSPEAYFKQILHDRENMNKFFAVVNGKNNYKDFLEGLIPQVPGEVPGGRGC